MAAERRYHHAEWSPLPARTKRALSYFQHALRTRPQFVAYSVKDLPAAIPWLARNVLGLPLLTWTVRTDEDRARLTPRRPNDLRGIPAIAPNELIAMATTEIAARLLMPSTKCRRKRGCLR
jgi:hypothetical protein